MSINWEDGKNTKALRKAILAVYPDRTDLAIFLEDELEENLEAIAAKGNLTKDVFELIKWAKAKGRIDELYQQLCQCNSSNSKIADFKREIEGRNLTPTQTTQIGEADWQDLRDIFTDSNLPEVSRAFLEAFERCLARTFHRVYPDKNPYDLDQIYQTLEDLDEPKLAAIFADRALTRMTAESNATAEQINQLSQWRDLRLASCNLTHTDIQTPDTTIKQGYLLVSLEENPKKTQKEGAFVNVYAELRVFGQKKPEPFGGNSTTCPLNKVAEHLGGLIQKAEQTVKNKITLELFLPCVHIEHDVASWKLMNDSQELGVLESYRPYLLRSFERAKSEVSQTCIAGKWKTLKDCVAASTACQKFHSQETCPARGDMEGLLSDATGLLLTAELSSDGTQRRRIISDIVNAAVPIALWFTEVEESSATERQTAFNDLLKAGCVTDFEYLAQQWRKHRITARGKPGRHLKLLCDCPDRWPDLPDANNNVEDALVSFG